MADKKLSSMLLGHSFEFRLVCRADENKGSSSLCGGSGSV